MSHTPESVITQIQTDITASNNKTGANDKTLHDAVSRLITGFGVQSGITPTGTIDITANGTYDVTEKASAVVNVPDKGITPSGTKNITSNGTHDVTNYASASVNVPVGITPSGTKTITANGTVDVTNFANALVNVQGLNARVFTSTVSADATSGSPTIASANEFIASIRSKSNAFVLVRYLGVKASTAMLTFWFATNTPIAYGGGATTAYNTILGQQSATYQNATFNTQGLTGYNYSGHLCVDTNGRLYCFPSSNYPLRAGTYQIVAGTMEML